MVFSSPYVATPTTTDCPHDEAASPLLPPSSPFKPVVPEPNGLRWGAHIYDHRARAVDDTLAGGNVARRISGLTWHAAGRAPPQPSAWAYEHLFQKVLTPSDVGNLNRLVVPKHHAEKHFFVKCNPLMAAGMGGVHLDFRDGEGKMWRFRYSYCRSSRIYIFTKGWRRYVREKGLQDGDTVAFSRSGFGPFKQLNIDYLRKTTTEKKQDHSRVVMLFGVDIAR